MNTKVPSILSIPLSVLWKEMGNLNDFLCELFLYSYLTYLVYYNIFVGGCARPNYCHMSVNHYFLCHYLNLFLSKQGDINFFILFCFTKYWTWFNQTPLKINYPCPYHPPTWGRNFSSTYIGLIQVKEEGWTGISKGRQGCSEGFPKGEARGKSRGKCFAFPCFKRFISTWQGLKSRAEILGLSVFQKIHFNMTRPLKSTAEMLGLSVFQKIHFNLTMPLISRAEMLGLSVFQKIHFNLTRPLKSRAEMLGLSVFQNIHFNWTRPKNQGRNAWPFRVSKDSFQLDKASYTIPYDWSWKLEVQPQK